METVAYDAASFDCERVHGDEMQGLLYEIEQFRKGEKGQDSGVAPRHDCLKNDRTRVSGGQVGKTGRNTTNQQRSSRHYRLNPIPLVRASEGCYS